MLDRVREALFSTLGPWLAHALDSNGATVLDLFAGSGSLGIEALSRGAKHACFVESDAATVALLTQNVVDLGLLERAEIVRGDALAWEPDGRTDPADPADIIFYDPPYPMLDDARWRRQVFEQLRGLLDSSPAPGPRALAPEGVVVFHAPRRKVREEDFAPGIACVERIYGTNSLWYLQREGEA